MHAHIEMLLTTYVAMYKDLLIAVSCIANYIAMYTGNGELTGFAY